MNQKLKAFSQLGFISQKDNNKELAGRCPFCGKDEHFSINKETIKYHCKKCGQGGGYKTFIEEIVKLGQTHFKGFPALRLVKDRELPLKLLKRYKVGYLPLKKVYIIPTVDSIRIYNFKTFVHLAGTQLSLFNSEQILDKKGTIWLCEGEWDTMAMDELITKSSDICIGVPGAGTFKAQWVQMFRDRKVNVIFDNDDAGRKGSIKVYNALKPLVRELKLIHWNEDLKEGYDLRDFYINKHTLPQLEGFLSDKPQGVDDVVIVKEDKYDGKGLELKEVYKRYRKWLHLPRPDILDAIFGTVIANRLDGDPLWLFLVGVPGSAKTELLMSMSDAPKTFSVSALQPHMLVSGYRAGGTDPSLILRLDQKVLLIKDFTTVLNMNQQTREETFGVLRDIYDGEHVRFFGNNAGGVYKSRFGLIAGVTPAIEQHTESHAALGERFLRYYIPITKDTQAYLKRAMSNVGSEKKMREGMRDIGTAVLNYDFTDRPTISDEMIDRILAMAQWVSMMRGTITRDRYSKDVMFRPFIELGTRLSKQFYKLLMGICMFRRVSSAGEKEFRTLKYIARSSVPSSLELVTKGVYKTDPEKVYKTSELVNMIGLPRITALRYTENLVLLGLVEKTPVGNSGEFMWKFTKEGFDVLERSKVYG